ncbi:jg23115 [Pararge aegeria aegeria]|uniref:Jg23115 protein n=1 Tax=Pararge aegeria aegeria TaxID=348720 RepID=A0A8S4QX16_9NEOP|nr:jg23115 [Pararge aegeria aegeria]
MVNDDVNTGGPAQSKADPFDPIPITDYIDLLGVDISFNSNTVMPENHYHRYCRNLYCVSVSYQLTALKSLKGTDTRDECMHFIPVALENTRLFERQKFHAYAK